MDFYHNTSAQLHPNVDPQNQLEKFIQFPLVRLVILIIFLLPIILFFSALKNMLGEFLDLTMALYIGYLLDVVAIIAVVLMYGLYTKIVENRKALEFSLESFSIELGLGVFLAMVILLFFVLLLWLLGFYKIDAINPFGNVVFMFFEQLKVGFVEELLFRVIIFKMMEELLGSWGAIAFQGILFGFIHAGNANATVVSTLALILSFSIFFGAGYMMTRRIWFIFGFHWSWNFFQAGIFGMPNSGYIQPSLITPVIEGPAWITGGAWGAELSLVIILILFILSLYFVKIGASKKQFIKPKWRS